MKKAIYKIENKINHKIYIGQSCNPERRFKDHCYQTTNYTSLIHRAIVKYGKENFSFDILGWYTDYNEKEKYFIQYYKSVKPYGYNISLGGEEPPHYQGEQNPAAKITQEQANRIISALQNWKIPKKTIIHNEKVTADIVRHINEGKSWKKENLSYPLRPTEREIDKYRVLYIQWLCASSDLPLNQIGAKVGWQRSAAKMINQGKNHYNTKLKYPIRNNQEYNKTILSQETCIDYLHFEE